MVEVLVKVVPIFFIRDENFRVYRGANWKVVLLLLDNDKPKFL